MIFGEKIKLDVYANQPEFVSYMQLLHAVISFVLRYELLMLS